MMARDSKYSKMDRRKFLKVSGTALIGSFLLSNFSCFSRNPSPKYDVPSNAPNVVFIPIDDLNDWIGVLNGHPDVKTPNIDRLASRGTLFANAHCQAPICNPSRVSALTGFLPSTTGVYTNNRPFRKALPDVRTIPQHFMDHGYTVVGAGKIFHSTYPDPDSWQEYFPSKRSHIPQDPVPQSDGTGDSYFNWETLDVSDDDMGDGKVSNWASEQLNDNLQEPFFLGVGMRRPHLPWNVPDNYYEMYDEFNVSLPHVEEDDLEDVPPLATMSAKHDTIDDGDLSGVVSGAIRGYLASISFVDAMIGKVIDALDQSKYKDNTVVVLWSDNGMHLGQKSIWGKRTLWEVSTKVPLIVADLRKGRGGVVVEQPVGLIDIFPTLIELCGLTGINELEGESLCPLMENPNASWERPALTTLEQNSHSLRSSRWRYTRYKDGTEELYDHERDRNELTNLANDSQYLQVKEDLARWFPSLNAAPSPRRDLVDKVSDRVETFILGGPYSD